MYAGATHTKLMAYTTTGGVAAASFGLTPFLVVAGLTLAFAATGFLLLVRAKKRAATTR